MTVVRAAAVGALALAVVVVAFILLRGDGGTEYKVRFISSGGLVARNDVQIGGRVVGAVKDIELSDNNQAVVKISVDDEFTPLHEGTTATIRALSLSGVGNRYLSISPGPNSNDELPDGATLTSEKTTSLVDLDQLFSALDKPTRDGLRNVVRGFSEWYSGNTLDGKPAAPEFNRSARYFPPFLSTTSRLIRELLRDQPTLNRFVVDTSRLVSTLAARRDELSALVGNANSAMAAIGSENDALSRTLQQLPPFLRKANTTFVNLRSTLDDLDVLVTESKPATRRLAPFLRVLRPLVRDAQPTIRDLRRLIREPGPANDTLDLLRRTPRLGQLAGRAFPSTTRALRGSQEIIEFLRPYGPDGIGFLRDFGQSASYYDANGHYARVSPMFNTFSFSDSPSGGTLTPVRPSQRTNGLQTGLELRCPGLASQPRPDGSTPFLDEGKLATGTGGVNTDCNPAAVPPGP